MNYLFRFLLIIVAVSSIMSVNSMASQDEGDFYIYNISNGVATIIVEDMFEGEYYIYLIKDLRSDNTDLCAAIVYPKADPKDDKIWEVKISDYDDEHEYRAIKMEVDSELITGCSPWPDYADITPPWPDYEMELKNMYLKNIFLDKCYYIL